MINKLKKIISHRKKAAEVHAAFDLDKGEMAKIYNLPEYAQLQSAYDVARDAWMKKNGENNLDVITALQTAMMKKLEFVRAKKLEYGIE